MAGIDLCQTSFIGSGRNHFRWICTGSTFWCWTGKLGEVRDICALSTEYEHPTMLFNETFHNYLHCTCNGNLLTVSGVLWVSLLKVECYCCCCLKVTSSSCAVLTTSARCRHPPSSAPPWSLMIPVTMTTVCLLLVLFLHHHHVPAADRRRLALPSRHWISFRWTLRLRSGRVVLRRSRASRDRVRLQSCQSSASQSSVLFIK